MTLPASLTSTPQAKALGSTEQLEVHTLLSMVRFDGLIDSMVRWMVSQLHDVRIFLYFLIFRTLNGASH